MKAMLDPNDSNDDYREEDLQLVDTDKKRELYQDMDNVNR